MTGPQPGIAGATSAREGVTAARDGFDAPAGPRATVLGWWFVIAGLIGFLSSLALAVERYASLVDADHEPSCNINAALSCSPAMGSWQGALLGFPNPYLGVAAFPVVVMFGVALLTGYRPPRWVWWGMFTGATAGLVLVHFLIWTSLVVLVVLCPYCVVVWLVTAPIWWYATVHLVAEGYLPLPRRGRDWVVRNRVVILVAWYLVLAGATVIGLRHLW